MAIRIEKAGENGSKYGVYSPDGLYEILCDVIFFDDEKKEYSLSNRYNSDDLKQLALVLEELNKLRQYSG